jgi:hypothetical protein
MLGEAHRHGKEATKEPNRTVKGGHEPTHPTRLHVTQHTDSAQHARRGDTLTDRTQTRENASINHGALKPGSLELLRYSSGRWPPDSPSPDGLIVVAFYFDVYTFTRGTQQQQQFTKTISTPSVPEKKPTKYINLIKQG